MVSLYPENSFYWRSARLRQADGTAWPSNTTAVGWLTEAAGSGPILGTSQTATQPSAGRFAITYTVVEATRIARPRIGATLYLVLVINAVARYETPVLVRATKPG